MVRGVSLSHANCSYDLLCLVIPDADDHAVSLGISLLFCCHMHWWENDNKMLERELVSNLFLIFGEI